MMQFETMSLLVGDRRCNARCPFCVADMSPDFELQDKSDNINWRNFHKAAQFARQSNVSHIVITSYGEPTIFPEQVTAYLKALQSYSFPFIEIQTNAGLIANRREQYQSWLTSWYDLGLDRIAISIVHYESEKNRQCYFPHLKKYIDLPEVIQQLRAIGYTVKLNCILAQDWIDSVSEFNTMVEHSMAWGADQISFRPVTLTVNHEASSVSRWVKEHQLSSDVLHEISEFLSHNGTLILNKHYGAKVYDLQGANVCLTNCLTLNADAPHLRQLIFYPSGSLRYDWQYNALLLAGWHVSSE